MFQPRVKCEFVRRYCPPSDGWQVFVDIDASEEGRTGGKRLSRDARMRQRQMQSEGRAARAELGRLGVTVGGDRAAWNRSHGFPRVVGDRDILAFKPREQLYLIAEVEGGSSGQPEQKLYKAIGQLVIAASDQVFPGWRRTLVLAVCGEEIARHLSRVGALQDLGIAAVAIGERGHSDRWVFGSFRPPKMPPE